MATWQGWVQDLLKAASLPDSQDNETFLSDWGTNEATKCTNNPVVISRRTRGSTNCTKLTATRTAQNYPGSGTAASAFSAQLHSGNFPHLLAALKDGTPYTVPSQHDVIADLVAWGAEKFAFELEQNYGPPQGGTGGGGGGNKAPKAHEGWKSLQRSINQTLPQSLRKTRTARAAALREIVRASKVRL